MLKDRVSTLGVTKTMLVVVKTMLSRPMGMHRSAAFMALVWSSRTVKRRIARTVYVDRYRQTMEYFSTAAIHLRKSPFPVRRTGVAQSAVAAICALNLLPRMSPTTGVGKALENLPELRGKLSGIIDRYHDAQQDILESFVDRGQLQTLSETRLKVYLCSLREQNSR